MAAQKYAPEVIAIKIAPIIPSHLTSLHNISNHPPTKSPRTKRQTMATPLPAPSKSNATTDNGDNALLTEFHQIIDDFITWLSALCIEIAFFIALLGKWIWMGLMLWWRCTVVMLFALLVVLGVNVLSLSLLGIGARWLYDWVMEMRRETERERFWAVRGRGRGRARGRGNSDGTVR
ncbi:hypothetical protein BDR22DRAFT_906219 [Usnea florida]